VYARSISKSKVKVGSLEDSQGELTSKSKVAEAVASEKDLGVVFSNDLKVRRHRQCEADPCLRITSRAYE